MFVDNLQQTCCHKLSQQLVVASCYKMSTDLLHQVMSSSCRNWASLRYNQRSKQITKVRPLSTGLIATSLQARSELN